MLQAVKAKAKRLVLTHFSARYKGDATPGALDVMQYIEDQARKIFRPKNGDSERVVAAWDLLTLPVPSPDTFVEVPQTKQKAQAKPSAVPQTKPKAEHGAKPKAQLDAKPSAPEAATV